MRAYRIALVLTVIAAVAGALLMWFFTTMECTDGDGGYPYVARDSAQADFCGATGNGLGMLAVAGLVIWLLAGYAWKRWPPQSPRPSGWLLPIAVLVVIVASPYGLTALYNLPSDTCSAEQEAAGGDCGHY